MIQVILTADEKWQEKLLPITPMQVTVWAVAPGAHVEVIADLEFIEEWLCDKSWYERHDVTHDLTCYDFLYLLLQDQINQFIKDYSLGGKDAIRDLGVITFTSKD